MNVGEGEGESSQRAAGVVLCGAWREAMGGGLGGREYGVALAEGSAGRLC